MDKRMVDNEDQREERKNLSSARRLKTKKVLRAKFSEHRRMVNKKAPNKLKGKLGNEE